MWTKDRTLLLSTLMMQIWQCALMIAAMQVPASQQSPRKGADPRPPPLYTNSQEPFFSSTKKGASRRPSSLNSFPLDHQQTTQVRVAKGFGFDRQRPFPSLLPSEAQDLC